MNSPLNFIYVKSETNEEISADQLETYINNIQDSSKAYFLLDKPDSNHNWNSEDTFKKWLKDRHEKIKNNIKERVENLLNE